MTALLYSNNLNKRNKSRPTSSINQSVQLLKSRSEAVFNADILEVKKQDLQKMLDLTEKGIITTRVLQPETTSSKL